MLNGWIGGTDTSREMNAIRADLADIMKRIGKVTSAAGDDVSDRLSGASSTAGRMGETAYGLMSQGRDLVGLAEDELSRGMRRTRSTVQANPLAGLAVAAGIGFLIGLASRTR
jgi:ElaB/YqjD/DUF883 family membrane-anchored ribosome-binding protein